MADSDRRRYPRKKEEIAIQVLLAPDHTNGRRESYDLQPARLRNKSQDGLYFEIDHTLQPGSALSIKVAAPVEDRSEDAYFMYDGRIIWCKKIGEKASRFGGGVKIVRKVVCADIQTSRF